MRLTLLLAAALALTPLSPAQSPAPTPDNDGGVSFDNHGQELLESITVPSIPNAPFSLTLATEWSRPQPNGGTFTLVNSRPIARDRAGRIYMERWLLTPKGSGIVSRISWIQIEDPVANTYYECNPQHRFCDLREAHPTPLRRDPALTTSGPLKSGKGVHTHTDLGEQSFAGVAVHGYREVSTLNPGTLGNDLPMTTTREFLYSPELGIDLRATLDTPPIGRQTFTVTDINLNDPDPALFQPPSGYKILDHRTTDRAQHPTP
jgi:hypothetical protein